MNELVKYTENMNTIEVTRTAAYALKVVFCLNKHRYEPIETCRPKDGNTEQQIEYDFAVKYWRVFMGAVYLYYIEIFIYTCIGAA